MTARQFHPRMGRARRRHELPGWVLALVAVLVVLATAAVEGSTPGAMSAFFHAVGAVAVVAVIVVAVAAAVALWVGFLVYCWRRMDGHR